MNLLKISLIFSFIGVFFLLILSLTLQPKEVSNYLDLKLNNYVKVTGKIISVKNFDDFSISKLDNNITLTCNNCNLRENQTITAIGTVEEYQSSLQINIEKIEII